MAEEIINIQIVEQVDNINITIDEVVENVSISIQEPSQTSDLVNNGSDGVHPFITLQDIPSGAVTSVNRQTGDVTIATSDNNFTNTLKTKLDGIADGAEVNVNADWNATSGDAQILNKPSLTGFGDMLKSTYDTDNTGVVDNAEAIKIIGRNSTGVTLRKGTIIYISGSTGNRPNFVKAQANGESTSAGTFGVIADDLANNTDGYALALGYLDNLDTRSNATYPFTTDTLSAGDTIYLSPTNAGYITNQKPSAPNHLVYLGKVTRTSPTNGAIVYRVQNGYELEELHNVAISSVANEDFLRYETSTSLWKNVQITASWILAKLGITILSGSNTGDETTATIKTKLGITTLSGSNTGDQDLSGYVPTTRTINTYPLNSNVTLTTADVADSTGKRYVSDANLTTIGNQSGTNTGDETTATIKTKLGAATTSTDGYLTSTNWNTFNGKQAALIYNPYRYLNTTPSTTTGTVTETVVATATITGGTFNSDDIMKMFFQASKSVTTSNVTMRVKIGSTSTFASATTIATYTFLLANGFVTMQRSFSLAGGNINCAAPTATLLTDVFATSTSLTAIAANPANALYVFFSVQLGTSGDSVNFTMAYLSN